jgi:AraC family transcriptional regulator, activator of mtrCDE
MQQKNRSSGGSLGRTTLPPALVEQLLNSMDVRIEAFALCRVALDSALVIPGLPDLKIIYVLTGTVYLTIEGCEQQELPPGSIVLIPKNRPQLQSGSKEPKHRSDVEEIPRDGSQKLLYVDAGTSHDTQVLCGWLRLGLTAEFSAFDGLVNPISANLNSSTFVRGAFETMIDESRFRTAGSLTLANTLMKACMVELFRHNLNREERSDGSPAIFLKPGLIRAVTAILSEPAAAHSVGSLAKIACMSRSAFAKAFEEAITATPIEFVAQARLAKARDLIVATDDSIGSIAESVGFASRSHFSSRFRERYGEDPTAYRKRMTARTTPDSLASVSSTLATADGGDEERSSAAESATQSKTRVGSSS